jgi:hypothetical protein
MGVLTVVERLRNQHGQVGAYKLALLEQQKASRAMPEALPFLGDRRGAN